MKSPGPKKSAPTSMSDPSRLENAPPVAGRRLHVGPARQGPERRDRRCGTAVDAAAAPGRPGRGRRPSHGRRGRTARRVWESSTAGSYSGGSWFCTTSRSSPRLRAATKAMIHIAASARTSTPRTSSAVWLVAPVTSPLVKSRMQIERHQRAVDHPDDRECRHAAELRPSESASRRTWPCAGTGTRSRRCPRSRRCTNTTIPLAPR